MKTFGQILNGALHWVFETEERPDFAPSIALIELTGLTPMPIVGDLWDGKAFTKPLGPTDDQRAAGLKEVRDSLIARTDWLVQRHRDEIDMQRATTLTPAAFAELLQYRQSLRDLPLVAGFPHVPTPAMPVGISELLEVA